MYRTYLHQAIVIVMLLLMLCGILIMCGVLVDFGYIYQQELAIACIVPVNIGFYYLTKYYNQVTPKCILWLKVTLIITALAVVEHFFFADATKHLLRAFAMGANGLLIAKFNLYIRIMISAILGKDEIMPELNK